MNLRKNTKIIHNNLVSEFEIKKPNEFCNILGIIFNIWL